MNWKDVPSLSSLKAFEATARLKNFSKAARELNVTHAAIAQHVRSLEDYFAESFVLRQGRGLEVTPKGAALANSLNDGFSTIIDGVNTLQSHSENRPLNITMTPAFASNWLMPRIGSFWSQYPDITINLNPSVQTVDLNTGEADMAIRFGNGNWPEFDVLPLVKDRFIVVASPDFMKDYSIDCLDQAQHLPWFFQSIMYERRLLFKSEGLDLGQATVTMLETNELVLSAVRSNAGLTLQPYALVEQAICDGVLQQLCELKDDGLGYYLVTKKGRETPALHTFKKWLQRVAKDT